MQRERAFDFASHIFVYEDVPDVAGVIEEITGVWPDGFNTYIQAIFPEDDYWPFPWYLREFDRVAYQIAVMEEFSAAAVIIFSPSVQVELLEQINVAGHSYVSPFNSYKQHRPAVELRVLVRKDLWENYQQYKVDQILQKTAGARDRAASGQGVLERAAKRAATTGNRGDLQEYLKLHKFL